MASGHYKRHKKYNKNIIKKSLKDQKSKRSNVYYKMQLIKKTGFMILIRQSRITSYLELHITYDMSLVVTCVLFEQPKFH